MSKQQAKLAPLVPEDKARRTAAGLVRIFRGQCEEGRVSGALAAQMVGVSRARWTTIQKQAQEEGPNLSAAVYLSLYQAVQVLRQGFSEGWLPAPGARGKAQDELAERIRTTLPQQ